MRIPRLLLVLLHQRSTFALSEHALPAGLQHGAAALVLAVSLGVALSLERLYPRSVQTLLQAPGPGREDPFAFTLLAWIYSGFLYVLYHPGVLLDAKLSGICAS